MTRTPLRVGLAFFALYAAVAVGTSLWGPGRLRPLFDGFASHPGEYSWVKPPKEFAEGNLPPKVPAQARIAFDAAGSSAALAETPDGQAMVSLVPGSVPPHPPDAAASLELTPADSSNLGPLPAGLRPEGNAYRATITYLPSTIEVAAPTAPGRVGVTSEVMAEILLFSPDGRSWRPVEAQPFNTGNALTGPFTEAGYYLPAGRGALRPLASSDGGPPVALFVVAAAVPLVLGYLLLGRRPSRPASGPARRRPPSGIAVGRRPPSKPKSTKKKRR